jgi:hypothetical protein
MHLTYCIIALLPLATVLAIPTPVNQQLTNGINKNLDAGNKELSTVQGVQSAINNNAPKAQIQQAESGVQGALNEAVNDRKANQQSAQSSGAAVQAGLAKVATAQAGAQSKINSLTGSKSDSPTINQLQSTFSKGFATNENNLKLVSQARL